MRRRRRKPPETQEKLDCEYAVMRLMELDLLPIGEPIVVCTLTGKPCPVLNKRIIVYGVRCPLGKERKRDLW